MAEILEHIFTRVCHVKRGYEDREEHIRREFSAHGIPHDFYLDFDIADIDSETLASSQLPPEVLSLALKHIGIWRNFLASDRPYCLVFEDDVFLAPDFVPKLSACIDEIGAPGRFCAVYLGNGCNYYIAARDLVPGRHLYPGTRSKCTDSYLITRSVAEARIDWLDKNALTMPIDLQIDVIDAELGVEVLWFERPIVEQGSQNGAFQSTLEVATRPLWQQAIRWRWKKFGRKIRGHG